MKKFLTSVCGLFCMIFLFSSCKTVGVLAAVGGIVGEIAGIEGSTEMAEAIMTSAESIEKAIEKIDPAQEYYIGRAVAAQILSKYETEVIRKQTEIIVENVNSHPQSFINYIANQ